eukprot:TRINITY_DN1934_c0_g1_i3.p1 TRINITY_DN1934_c0_g1~~TRINITY_DN1934_c0_g1_i3.p1  ORF type:complete len:732 (+),score=165.71 TRINITY_DN1934_c0_g1_i3:46-2241(+)
MHCAIRRCWTNVAAHGLLARAYSTPPAGPAPAATRMFVPPRAAGKPERPDLEERFRILRSVGEECITEDELRKLLNGKPNFRLYDGFEPSGRMHIAQGLFKAMNVNKCTQVGGKFIFWVADWFALMNDKMGGDIDKIQTVGKYLIEVWKAAGMDMANVEFVWTSEEITKHANEYWTRVLDIARRFTIARMRKCCQIMGRQEGNLTAAQILYPLMQCADIFFLKADVCQLGVDQRKVNMLAREYCDAAGIKLKPIILSHHMMFGLLKDQEKMSKSNPDSAIFMEDDAENVARKLRNAHCPREPEEPGKPLKNACLDYIEHLLFNAEGSVWQANGKEYRSFAEVRDDFVGGVLPEAALKDALILSINEKLQPVRDHFQSKPEAKQLLELVRQFTKEPAGVGAPLQPPAAPIGAVFAPLPGPHLSIATVHSVLTRLRAVPEGHVIVLWFADWSAFVSNSLNGNLDAIRASYTLLLAALRSLAPEFMEKVSVQWQSHTILEQPSDYWIRVINVGRSFSLQRVCEAFGLSEQSEEESGPASAVVAGLLHVGDILALRPAFVSADPSAAKMHELAVEYCANSKLLAAPAVAALAGAIPPLKQDGADNDPDSHVFLLDDEKTVGTKLKKKAFCQPNNVEFNPPLSLIAELVLPTLGEFPLARKPDNGGDKIYTSAAELSADIVSGAVHPADLKPAVVDSLNRVMDRFRSVARDQPEVQKAVQTMADFNNPKKGGKKKN